MAIDVFIGTIKLINMKVFRADNKINRMTPGDLVRKHIMDRNHVVTEEELWSLRVGVDAEDDLLVKEQVEKFVDEIIHGIEEDRD